MVGGLFGQFESRGGHRAVSTQNRIEMQLKTADNLSNRPDKDSEIIQPIEISEELFIHGSMPDIHIDYGITTDALGSEETQDIWHSEIGKQPALKN